MNELSVMTMGFCKALIKPFLTDGNLAGLRGRYFGLFEEIKESGFNLIDVADFEINVLGEDWFLSVLQKTGLALNCYITAGEFAREDFNFDAKKALDFCKTANANTLMLVPTAHKEIEQDGVAAIHGHLIENFSRAAEAAKAYKIPCVIEDTPDLSLHLCRAADVKHVLDGVDGLMLVYDSANMLFAGEDPVEYARAFAGRIAHVHLKNLHITDEIVTTGERMADGRKTVVTMPHEGIVDFNGVLQELRRQDYRESMAAEFNCDENFGAALKAARVYFEQIMDGLA